MIRLTSRERWLRMFRGKDIDRYPIWLLFPWHRLNCYANVYEIECYKPIVKRISCGDCDSLDRRGINTGFCFNANPDIVLQTRTYQSGRNIVSETILNAPGCELKKSISRGDDNTTVKYFVDDPQKLKDILSIPYVAPRPDLDIIKKERIEFGDKGLFMLDIGDPLAPLYHLMSATDFSMATATDYELLLEFLDVLSDRVLEVYKYTLENEVADCYFIVGSEFAGPPLVSPAKFNELSVRYVKKIVNMIRKYGKLSIVHYHGNLSRVFDGMREINPDGLHTIEAPPIGDCSIVQAREALDDIALIGNIQYDDLIRLNVEQIREQVRDVMRQARTQIEGVLSPAKFVLSPTAGPYEEFIDERAVENYLAMIDAGLEFGSF